MSECDKAYAKYQFPIIDNSLLKIMFSCFPKNVLYILGSNLRTLDQYLW